MQFLFGFLYDLMSTFLTVIWTCVGIERTRCGSVGFWHYDFAVGCNAELRIMKQPFGLMLLKSAIIQSEILLTLFLFPKLLIHSEKLRGFVCMWRGKCSHGHTSKAATETSADAHNHKTSISENVIQI